MAHIKKTLSIILLFLFSYTSAFAAMYTWDFSLEDAYVFDTSVIEFSGATAQLKATSTPTWYDLDWEKRKPIFIDNTGNASTLSDYEVEISLEWDSDMRDDFGDVRFTSDTGTTSLNYWLETKTDSDFATFWVQVPTIAALATTTIYAYYDNPSETTISDGDSTFRFFDDFIPTGAEAPVVRFGIFGSAEHGDDDGTGKLGEAVATYNDHEVDFVVELGDIIDYNDAGGGIDNAGMLAYLDEIEEVYSGLNMPRYYVFGNHDLDYISKEDFMAHTGKNTKYESFDYGDYHFIILDANYRSDNDEDDYDSGNFDYQTLYIPPNQRAWLESDLAATSKKTIVFVEQNLTTMPTGGCTQDIHVIDNAPTVRTILENSNKVLAVFSNHSGINCSTTLNGINYYGTRAMDLSATNAYAEVSIYADDSISIYGYGEQSTYNLATYTPDSSKWNLDNTPVLHVVSDEIIIGSNAVSTWEGIVSDFTMNSGVMEFRTTTAIPNAEGFHAIGIVTPAMSGGAARNGVLFLPTGSTEIRKYVSGTATNFDANVSYPLRGEIQWSGSDFVFLYNDVQALTSTLSTTNIRVALESFSNASAKIADWVFVRTYTATEPGISFGAEERPYASNSPAIQPDTESSQAFTTLSDFSTTENTNGGTITYQVSNDAGATWYWYDSGWATTTAGATESNLATTINTNIETFPTGDGLFLFRAYLNSDGNQLVTINDVIVTYTLTEPDITPPLISLISSGTPSATSATITWITDEPSDSQVQYGTTDSYGLITALDSSATTSHSVFLSDLEPETLYHYQIITTDASNNTATSSNQTFTTQALPDEEEVDDESDEDDTPAESNQSPFSYSSSHRRTDATQIFNSGTSITDNATLKVLMEQLILLLQQLLAELIAEQNT